MWLKFYNKKNSNKWKSVNILSQKKKIHIRKLKKYVFLFLHFVIAFVVFVIVLLLLLLLLLWYYFVLVLFILFLLYLFSIDVFCGFTRKWNESTCPEYPTKSVVSCSLSVSSSKNYASLILIFSFQISFVIWIKSLQWICMSYLLNIYFP